MAANYGTAPVTLNLELSEGKNSGVKVLLSNKGKEREQEEQARKDGSITLNSCESVVLTF